MAKYSEHDLGRAQLELASEGRKLKREEFLRATNAQPTPVAFYAAWLCAWLRGGGQITHPRSYDYASIGTLMEGNSVIRDPSATPPFASKAPPADPYKHLGISRWTPTRSTNTYIPVGYGSGALELLIAPQLVSIPMKTTSGDHRSGWEWGHSTVLKLIRQGDTIKASTNHPDVVASYPDVSHWIEQQGGRDAVIRQSALSLRRTPQAQTSSDIPVRAIESH